mgnify:CR=1 FL=1
MDTDVKEKESGNSNDNNKLDDKKFIINKNKKIN